MTDLSESTTRITTAELLALVDGSGTTARTLEYWRQEGLLPKAERTGQTGKRPEWSYPGEAAEQLTTLLRLRKKTKQPDVLRVALWFEGFPIDSTRVQASLVADLRSLLDLILREVHKRQHDSAGSEISTWEALEQIARRWARKRGSKAPPRYGRQRLEDRERAMTLAFGLLLGLDGVSGRLKEDVHHVERMIGIDRGRNPLGKLPALLHGPAGEALAGFTSLCSLPALINAAENTSEDELATSRALARVMLNGLVTFARITDSVAVTDNAMGLAAIETLRNDPNTAIWLTALVVAVKPAKTLNDNLQALTAALSESILPIDQQARELAALSPDALNQKLPELPNLPFLTQVAIKRLIGKYHDEQPGEA
jgi:DNA-binding transcriptional MerR regulator